VVEQDAETNAIAVNFDQPVRPGEVVTIGLKPRRNPRYSDIYLFSVTAFPSLVRLLTVNFWLWAIALLQPRHSRLVGVHHIEFNG
jgi:hypothetical protein